MIYRAEAYPEALEELFAVLPEDADRNEVIEAIVKAWGGHRIYIPVRYGYDVTARNKEIIQRYNGRNRDQLCKEFGIGRSRFYSILRKGS